MTLKIKDKKIIWTKLYLGQFYVMRKFELQGSFFDKGSGIFSDPDPVTQKDRIRIRNTAFNKTFQIFHVH